METEASKTVVLPFKSLKAAPFTRKLLGDSHINLKKFSSCKDFNPNSTSFEQIEHIEHFNAVRIDSDPNKSKSKTTYFKMINGKLDELKQKRTVDSGEFKSVKQVHKTAKFAMIFKLKKEEVKQMQSGDTTILKSFFKNLSTESVLKPENFEIMSEQNLQTIIENIRQTASVIQGEGTKKLELPLGVWSTNGPKHGTALRKHHLTNNSRHTDCEYTALDSGFSHKPLRALMKHQNCQLHLNKATQYEPLKDYREAVLQKLCLDRAIQCELLTPVLSPRCRSRREAKSVQKCTQVEPLCKKLSETSMLLLQQDILYSKRIDEELLRSLHESQDSLEITRKKFSDKQYGPQDSLQQAGEVQTSGTIDGLELPREWCEITEEDKQDVNTDSNVSVAMENVKNDVKSKNERSLESPVQFDDTIFAFLDEIYSDLSLSEQDDFRTTLKVEAKDLPKGILRKGAENSKIPKPCLKKINQTQPLQKNGSRKSLLSSESKNASPDTGTMQAEKIHDGNSKQSKIPIFRARAPASQSQLVKPNTGLSNRSAKALKACDSKKNVPMRQIRSAISFDSEQKNSSTYYERQRKLIEIIVKGVEQEMKSCN